MKRSQASRLPNKFSKLLLAALADLELCEADSKTYHINMLMFHKVYEGRCNVCFAGAYMAMSLKIAPNRDYNPINAAHSEEMKLYALDSARQSEWETALEEFYGRVDAAALMDLKMIIVPEYRHSPSMFKDRLRKAARILEAHKL